MNNFKLDTEFNRLYIRHYRPLLHKNKFTFISRLSVVFKESV